MHICLAAIVANTPLPQNSRRLASCMILDYCKFRYPLKHISSHSGTHTCSHCAHAHMHILITFFEVSNLLLKCVHFFYMAYFLTKIVQLGSFQPKIPFFTFSTNFLLHTYVGLHKIKFLLSCFWPNTSEMVETTKKFEVSTLSCPYKHKTPWRGEHHGTN